MNALDAPLTLRLPAALARKLAKAGIETLEDLLFNAPRRYYHWGALTPMSVLRKGEEVTILAQVESALLLPNRSKPGVRLEIRLTDGISRMNATFFASSEHKLSPHLRLLVPGASFLFAGKVGAYRGALSLVHPSFAGMEGDEEEARAQTERPIPIYAQTKGLTSWVVARAVGMVLDSMKAEDVPDLVPSELRHSWNMPSRFQALQMLHRPRNDEEARQARRGFALEEAFLLECVLAGRRFGAQSLIAPSCPKGQAVDDFIASLPFSLTASQEGALGEIMEDLASTQPMQRLLQGDVGAGKTVVALAALLAAVDAGHQGALVAPTEVLATQHLASMRSLVQGVCVRGMQVDIRLLTGSTSVSARREIHALMSAGAPVIVVGTHALLQESVSFADLGVVVVDEQHRFGVAQRDHLRTFASGRAAHQLVMTATPIPRTVAMTVFGDLEETRMTGLPPGRTPVKTFLVDAENAQWMKRLWERAAEEIADGGRVYVVCPRIDEGEDLEDAELGDAAVENAVLEDREAKENGSKRPPLASVSALAQSLRESGVIDPEGIAELTGRTSPVEKAAIMEAFSTGLQPVLVATTVIEVGVDVPEATMMVICDAQQFGISQLHQLRGRVGRSQSASLCMAVHRHDLASGTMERLEAFAATTNGFELAEKDLELRREGDVLGADQSGKSSHLRFLSVRRDSDVIRRARGAAIDLVGKDPGLIRHPVLADELRRRGHSDLVWLSRS